MEAFSTQGNGTMTIQGTAGTYNGDTSINAGTLSISTIGAINASTGWSIITVVARAAGRVPDPRSLPFIAGRRRSAAPEIEREAPAIKTSKNASKP